MRFSINVSRWASRKSGVVTRIGKGKPFHARLGGSCPGESSRSFRVSLASHPSPVSACLSAAGGWNFAARRAVPFPRARSSTVSSPVLIHPRSIGRIRDFLRENAYETSATRMFRDEQKVLRPRTRQRWRSGSLRRWMSFVVRTQFFHRRIGCERISRFE